ncbi:MAG: hypothetical protein Q8K79_02125 [Solirubrobacteraceae bacterium]|nr:hypothetical protein [Solirubrobacteraceae bacterium]
MSALQIKSQLEDLQAERALADIADLGDNGTYMLDLEGEIAATRTALELAILKLDAHAPAGAAPATEAPGW